MFSVISFRKRIFHYKENKLSGYRRISCGVPQGSIVRPLLFLIYVNDMPQAVNPNLSLYADNSGLIFQYKDVEEINSPNQFNSIRTLK